MAWGFRCPGVMEVPEDNLGPQQQAAQEPCSPRDNTRAVKWTGPIELIPSAEGARLSPCHTGIRLAAAGSRSQCVRTSGASWHKARLRPPTIALGVTCSPGPAPGPRDCVPNQAWESAASQMNL
ncbi:Protein Tanc1 [Manis pentadactyla]|nr:Protein Tanc1 [Manis pentadactyla]